MSPDKLDDPKVVLFQGEHTLDPGDVQLHSLVSGLSGRVFGKSLEDVKADWRKITTQVKEMLESVVQEMPRGFLFESVEVSLGFSAEGKLVFIAQAGVEASVSLTFKRA